MSKNINKLVKVGKLRGKLKYYEARNVVQRQEIRRLKQIIKEGGNYISIQQYFYNLISYFRHIWKR